MPAPKLVFAVGSCACGGVWNDTYSVSGPVENVIPVDYYILGCPPRTEAILFYVAEALGVVEEGGAGHTPSCSSDGGPSHVIDATPRR
jgi:membrane-bound hydrogenase subunit mbhJ